MSGAKGLLALTATCVLVVLVALATGRAPAQGAGAQVPATAEAAAGSPKVTVAGEIPIRPELEVFQGVRGWMVNGQEVKLDDVRDRAVLYHGPFILQDMVCEVLLQQEAKQRGITATEAEVDSKIQEVRNEMGLTSDATLDFYLRRSRLTAGWLRDKARDYVLIEKVLGDQVYVSDKDVESFYNQYRDQYLRPESVDFRAISLPTEKEAQAALVQIRSGKSFQQVAKQVALPEEKATAGDLHSFEKGQRGLPPEVEAVLFSAPLDQVAGPIKTGSYYNLLRVEKRRDAYQFSLAEVRDTIRTQLRRQKLEQAVWPKWIEARLGGATIEALKAQ